MKPGDLVEFIGDYKNWAANNYRIDPPVGFIGIVGITFPHGQFLLKNWYRGYFVINNGGGKRERMEFKFLEEEVRLIKK